MKQAITLLIASSAISLAGAAFAGAAAGPAHAFVFEGPTADTAPTTAAPLWRVSGDDDEGEDGEGWFFSKPAGDESDDEGEDGDGEDDDCDADDDEDGGCTAGAAGNAAPVGTVAPPRNGLFTNGTAPQVKTN